MQTKTKIFDCVEMKNQIQGELLQEYRKRECEFSSFVEFINNSADQDPKIQAFRERIIRNLAND